MQYLRTRAGCFLVGFAEGADVTIEVSVRDGDKDGGLDCRTTGAIVTRKIVGYALGPSVVVCVGTEDGVTDGAIVTRLIVGYALGSSVAVCVGTEDGVIDGAIVTR